MENPWLNLSEQSPFILSSDIEKIQLYNLKQKDDMHRIVLEELPSPYIGNPHAPVVFLNLNPAYSPDESQCSNYSKYKEIAKINLSHKFSDYPFYVLDPSLKGSPSGFEWFKQRFNPLIQSSGLSDKKISDKLFLIEYFPYRSQKYNWKNDLLPSQYYSFSLVKSAIDRKAIIVIMRGTNLWFNTVPELKNYENLYILHSCQNVTISENNLGYKGFWEIINKLISE